MTVVALVNQKGGVGKTTVALGLAAVAARRGLRVAVVDIDPQANATSGMAVWEPASTVTAALRDERDGSLRDVVAPSGWADHFDTPPSLAASAPDLAHVEPQMAIDPIGAQDRLERSLAGVDADLVLIDCPPSLGLLTVNGLFAADAAVVVTEPSAWALDGVEQILRNIGRIAGRRGGRPVVAGIVVNRLARTRDSRYWDEQLCETHPDLVIRPAIPLKAAIGEAAAQSLPVTAVSRPGAAESVAILEQVLDRILERADVTTPRAGTNEGIADAAV